MKEELTQAEMVEINSYALKYGISDWRQRLVRDADIDDIFNHIDYLIHLSKAEKTYQNLTADEIIMIEVIASSKGVPWDINMFVESISFKEAMSAICFFVERTRTCTISKEPWQRYIKGNVIPYDAFGHR